MLRRGVFGIIAPRVRLDFAFLNEPVKREGTTGVLSTRSSHGGIGQIPLQVDAKSSRGKGPAALPVCEDVRTLEYEDRVKGGELMGIQMPDT